MEDYSRIERVIGYARNLFLYKAYIIFRIVLDICRNFDPTAGVADYNHAAVLMYAGYLLSVKEDGDV
jgi:hypothetical protein